MTSALVSEGNAFYGCRGIVRYEFTPEDQTIRIFIWCLLGICRMWYKESALEYRLGNLLLHQVNAPAYKALTVRQFLAKKIQFLPFNSLPYLPDLSPADFFLFLKLKITLEGRRFRQVKTSPLM
jgi:hypothetical protein